MLEAVVVIGVLLALAIISFFSYGALIDNAKRAKVKFEASVLYTASSIANSDGDPLTEPLQTIKDYNDSTKYFNAVIKNGSGSSENNSFSAQPGKDFCVTVVNVERQDINATFGDCSVVNNENGGVVIKDEICGVETPQVLKLSSTSATNKVATKGMLDYLNCDVALYYHPEMVTFLTNATAYTDSNIFRRQIESQIGHSYELDILNLKTKFASSTDLDEKLNIAFANFLNNQTTENQKTFADLNRKYYEYLINQENQEPYRLVASPSYSEMLPSSITVKSGTKDAISIRVAIPKELDLKYNSIRWGIREDYARETVSSAVFTIPEQIDGNYRYYDLVMTPNDLWDSTKTYTGIATATESTENIFYTHSFNILVK